MNDEPDHQDELKAENELLKLKLELEHGMARSETGNLNPELENKWLRYLYDFERLSKETPMVKVYDLLGKPEVTPLSQLAPDQVLPALEELEVLMLQKGIALDCICEYDPSIIYKFITEELFEEEIQDMGIEGMVHHFCYEEFHPNHNYDIQKLLTDFIEDLITKKWDGKFHALSLAQDIFFNGQQHCQASITQIIEAFQEANQNRVLKDFEIQSIAFDLEKEAGSATATVNYSMLQHGEEIHVTGLCRFGLSRPTGYWDISEFELPGLSSKT